MVDENKFLAHDLLCRVLPYLGVRDQLVFRRVNHEFKNTIENVTWPALKSLNLVANFDGLDPIPIDKWPLLFSFMPNLEVVKLHIYRGLITDETIVIQDYLVKFLAIDCFEIKSFGEIEKGELTWTVKYAAELCNLGLDIEKNNFIFYVKSSEDGELLNMLPEDAPYLVHWSHLSGPVPDRYLEKLYNITSYDDHIPYLASVREIDTSVITPMLISDYHSQITCLYVDVLQNIEHVHNFENLRKLSDYHTGDNSRAPHERSIEMGYLKSLERFLESDNSRHLHSLQLIIDNRDNFNHFISRISNIDHPIKWKNLDIAYFETADRQLFLEYTCHKLTYCFDWPFELMPWILNLVDSLKTTTVITLSDVDNVERTISRLQFSFWAQWLASYASEHRNKQITLELWPKKEDKQNMTIDIHNCSIIFPSGLIK